MFAPAPALPPATLESAYIELHAAAKIPEDPIALLARPAPAEEKLGALDALHGSLPYAAPARRVRGLAALQTAAASSAEAPAVRARALAYLGYAVPVVEDEGARGAAVRALLDAARSPAYRVFALRGLAPATHGLTPAVEAPCLAALLDLLAGTLSEEERVTALMALDAFVRAREDLPRRRPDLAAALEASVLAPLEARPAALQAGSPEVRSLTIAVVWHAARNRAALGDAAALPRVEILLKKISVVETDASVKTEILSLLAAPAPKIPH